MATQRSIVTAKKEIPKKESPEWLRCQHAIRKLLLNLGKDALFYAKGSLENEQSEPERLKVFWGNAKRFFDEYEMPVRVAPKKAKPQPKPEVKAPAPAQAPGPPPPLPAAEAPGTPSP